MRFLLLFIFSLLSCRTNEKETIDDGFTEIYDADSDGYPETEDCDDTDANINSGMPEVCDGIDNNCDGNIDEGVSESWYVDNDQDGFGDSSSIIETCGVEEGLSAVGGDCDDYDATSFPSNPEVCDGVDNNCDGAIDEGVGDIYYADEDGDGFGDSENSITTCDVPDGYVTNNEDCDDTMPSVYPEAVEICDEIDNDCDGDIDEDGEIEWFLDNDADGFGDSNNSIFACELVVGYATISGDCDDSDSATNPLADEFCQDGIDNDCDGDIDEADAADALTWYLDADSDGYGDINQLSMSCEQPTGYVSDNTDCNDGESTSYPTNTEVCGDNIDNDCDGLTDDPSSSDALIWYADSDADGFGENASPISSCTQPSGYVADNTDCNDALNMVNPDAAELCNNIDDNCDGDIDEDSAADSLVWFPDDDGDGFGNPAISIPACNQPSGYVADNTDCDDFSNLVNPSQTEVLDNGVDDDCDGLESCYMDNDDDGFVSTDLTLTTSSTDLDCDDSGEGASTDPATDCNDSDNNINTNADEICGDNIDNDCDGLTDDPSSSDALIWYADSDADGFGENASPISSCTQPSGYVADNTDCNDSEAASFPGNPEVCDNIDNDCNMIIDDGSADAQPYYADDDGDGFGDINDVLITCAPPSEYVLIDGDCDDNDNDINPNADELCDGEDNNCDGNIDEDTAIDALIWYIDSDGDGFGDGTPLYSCTQPSGYVSDNTDCDDSDNTVNTNGSEQWYDSTDSDCDGNIDPDPCSFLPGDFPILADQTCSANYGSSANWTIQIEWQANDIGYSTASSFNQVMMRPSVGQLTDDNGDGVIDEYDTPDIVFSTYSGGNYSLAGYLRVFSGDGSGEHYSLYNAGGGAIFSSGGVALGDADLDGLPDIVTTMSNGKVIALEGSSGVTKWTSSVTVSGYTQPALYDVDGDGDVEVLADRYLLDGSDGSLITDFSTGGYYQSIAEDINRDGQLEIFTGGNLYTHQGAQIWSSGLSAGPSAIANFDTDPEGEIVIRSNNVTYLLDDDGSVLWSSNIGGYGNPCVADFDGDGMPEVGLSSGFSMSVVDTDGSLMWQQATYDPSNGTMGCSAFDFEGDGYAELIYSDRSNLWIFAGLTGNVIYNDPLPASGSLWEYSYVADVDNDGSAEIVLPSNNYSISGYTGLVIYGEANDAWASARTQHNQHAYNNAYINDNMEVIASNVGWDQLNGYRQQASWSEQPDGAPDMSLYMLGACDSCNTNSTTIFVAAENQGSVFVPEGTPIDVYAINGNSDVYIDTLYLEHRLDPGVRSAPLSILLNQSEVGVDGLRFVFDPNNTDRECNEQNNSIVFNDPVCQ